MNYDKGYTAGLLTRETHITDGLSADQINNALVFARVCRAATAAGVCKCIEPACAACDYVFNCALLDEANHFRLLDRRGLVRPRRYLRLLKRLHRGKPSASRNISPNAAGTVANGPG